MPLMINIKKAIVFGGERGEGLQKTEKLSLYADDLLVVPEGPDFPKEIRLKAGLQPHVNEKLFLPKDRVIPVFQQAAHETDLESLISGAVFVTSDLADRELNEKIRDICNASGVLCNIIDTKDLCNTWFMSLIDTGNMVLGISSKGSCAFYTRQTREELQEEMEHRSPVASLLTIIRSHISPNVNKADILKALYNSRDFQTILKQKDYPKAQVYGLDFINTNSARFEIQKKA